MVVDGGSWPLRDFLHVGRAVLGQLVLSLPGIDNLVLSWAWALYLCCRLILLLLLVRVLFYSLGFGYFFHLLECVVRNTDWCVGVHVGLCLHQRLP